MRKITLLLMLVLLCGATGAFADTIYLKDGNVVRGKIAQEDESTIMLETGHSWRRIDKSAIEAIKKDDETERQAESQANTSGSIRRQAPRKDSGLYLGFQMPYNMIGGDFDGTYMPEVDPGLGIGLIFGYRFNPQFGMEIDWSGSSHNSEGADIGFGEFSLNFKISMLPGETTCPFLFAGIGSFALGDDSLTLGGPGYNVGLGLDFQVGEKNTIGLAVIRKIITYNKILESTAPSTLVGDINGDTTSIRFDFTHQF